MWKRKASPVGGFRCHLGDFIKSWFRFTNLSMWLMCWIWLIKFSEAKLWWRHGGFEGRTCRYVRLLHMWGQSKVWLRGRTSSYWSKCLKNRELKNEAIESNPHCINRWPQLVCMRRFRKSNTFLLYVSVSKIIQNVLLRKCIQDHPKNALQPHIWDGFSGNICCWPLH